MSQPSFRAFALAVAIAATVAAGAVPVPPFAAAPSRADEAPKIFHGVGVVTAVDAQSGMITVDHDDIPGLMDSMEMAYKVRPFSLAAGLRKGDKIAFDVDGKTYTILAIRKANP